ncbi:hypothetical protein V498_00482 [Pseudogymnoascus sp. VKM F-4517 (FW-2822)]|nr:hypothetical protein V498_00482 [Pseudogymnoascus sp. VKM F-4517 (FW-2822)]
MASTASSVGVVSKQPSAPDCRLSSKSISPNDRKAIASNLFSIDLLSRNRHIAEGLDAYFNQWCMRLCQSSAIAVRDSSDSYEHLLQAVAILKRASTSTETFKAEYAALFPHATSDEAETFMLLATRLLCMLKIGPTTGADILPRVLLKGSDGFTRPAPQPRSPRRDAPHPRPPLPRAQRRRAAVVRAPAAREPPRPIRREVQPANHAREADRELHVLARPADDTQASV